MFEPRQAIVTIDGPAGVGKSTISRHIAAELSFTYLDTGSMYRAIAWSLAQTGKTADDLSHDGELLVWLQGLELELLPPLSGEEYARVRIAHKLLGPELRTEEMSRLASAVSALPQVRKVLTAMQQHLGEAGEVVAEGRDTGTVVFPCAAWKFFLDATPEERARRRVLQLRTRGEDVSDESVLLQNLIARDQADRNRAIAPLCPADDARIVDTTNLSITEVMEEMLQSIREHPL